MTMARPTSDLRSLNPLITPRAGKLLEALQEHPDAPRWNYRTGDWITADDLEALEAFRADVFAPPVAPPASAPPPRIVQALASVIPQVEWLRRRIASGTDLARAWPSLPCMTREDLATDMGSIVPDDADLAGVAVYETSGTTGHRLPVPNSARGASSYAVLLERAMRQHGVVPDFSDDRAGCFLVGAQQKTVTYATVHAVWNNSGYAKLNLRAGEWPTPGGAARFIAAFDPPVLCGDPIAFAEMLRLGIEAHPLVMLSTAVSLPPLLKRRLEEAYHCSVIDTYSLNESGLVAYTCPEGFFHVLPPDLHVEIVGPNGRPLPPAERGEVAVTVFRNPYLPLLRYRTGDYARLDLSACACRDPAPRLLEFEGRAPVLFRAADGSVVNTVDMSRVLRGLPLVQHRVVQDLDGSCEAWIRPIGEEPASIEADVAAALAGLIGHSRITVHAAPDLGLADRGKVVAYQSAFRLVEDGRQ